MFLLASFFLSHPQESGRERKKLALKIVLTQKTLFSFSASQDKTV